MKKQAWHYDEVEKYLKYLPRKLRINFITIAFAALYIKKDSTKQNRLFCLNGGQKLTEQFEYDF